MRGIVLVAGLLAACAARGLPDGEIVTIVDPEYDFGTLRHLALGAVDAPDELLPAVRRRLRRFVGKPRTGDAVLTVAITRFERVRGTRYFVSDGHAELRDRAGRQPWSCRIEDFSFEVPQKDGEPDVAAAGERLATLFLDRLPRRNVSR